MTMDEAIAIKKIRLYYTILAALFFMLSSQFTGFLMPILLLIPIIMGLIGIKSRRKSGYLIGMAIVPLGVSISVLWIRYSMTVFADSANEFAKISTDYGVSILSARVMTIGFFLLSIAMICLAVLTFMKLRKHKELFT